ncbi:hypothetical protein [Geodermatophilus sp. SYSU D00684]
MTTSLVIGVLWLAGTALLAVLVARAIRAADRREERRTLETRAATPARGHRDGRTVPGPLAPFDPGGVAPPYGSDDRLPSWDADRPDDDVR